MKRIILMASVFLSSFLRAAAQEIQISETASLEQVYGRTVTSGSLKSFNEINVEFGYVLYESQITLTGESAVLELENVRDYAAVSVDSVYLGSVTDNEKKVSLNVGPGRHQLLIYTENIGRITYGPEILDNSKGLFGRVAFDGEDITGWKITPLQVKAFQATNLKFKDAETTNLPAFHKAFFTLDSPKSAYLNMSGWGMGEAWVNGHYVGSFWEKEKLQSIQVKSDIFKRGTNEIVIFELKNNSQKTVKLVDQPAFN